jgi:hypothetical protein
MGNTEKDIDLMEAKRLEFSPKNKLINFVEEASEGIINDPVIVDSNREDAQSVQQKDSIE